MFPNHQRIEVNHIYFVRTDNYTLEKPFELDDQSLYLLNPFYKKAILGFNFFESMPKLFKISTRNGSCYFNTDLLKDTSPIIAERLEIDPNDLQFFLDVEDDRNILQKIGQLYEGKKADFDENDCIILNQINQFLKIDFPAFQIQDNSNIFDLFNNLKNKMDLQLTICMKSFYSYIQNNISPTFTIITKKKRYLCNSFGVLSSKKICAEITKNPTQNQFFYDFDDECDEFQFICDLFNFKIVKISRDNMHVLKEMIDSLQIEVVMNEIDKYIDDMNQTIHTIDEQEDLVNSIDLLFTWLSTIDKNKVDSVKNSIIESFWSKTEENVQELVAFILQVLRSNFSLHHNLIELVIRLDSEANENNKLGILIPFLVDKLMSSFGQDKHDCSFIYNLCKKGFIQKDVVREKITAILDMQAQNEITQNVIDWFFPEIATIEKYNINLLVNNCNDFRRSFFKSYLPDKLDKYIEMLDKGEPDNELLLAIRYDDVDSLQSFISMNRINILQFRIPYSIYEDERNVSDSCTFFDYSVKYGAVKCFKYLLLNHAKPSYKSFRYAVEGGNTEIIKIVDQNLVKEYEDVAASRSIFGSSYQTSQSKSDQIYPAIRKHNNDVFNWFLEEKIMCHTNANSLNELTEIYIFAAMNGNASALISIIDKGFNILSQTFVIQTAVKFGFYRTAQLLFNIIVAKFDKEKVKAFARNVEDFIWFGNLSIFKLLVKMTDSSIIEQALTAAVKNNSTNIIKYFFSEAAKNRIKVSQNGAHNALQRSIEKNSDDLFDYLLNQYKLVDPDIYDNFNWTDKILPMACLSGKIEIVKTIVNLFLESKMKKKQNMAIPSASIFKGGLSALATFQIQANDNFTQSFINAIENGSYEICKIFIDNELNINYSQLSNNISLLSKTSEKIFSLIADNCPVSMRNAFITRFLYPAIQANNKPLVKYLLENNSPSSNALLEAVDTNDVEMVDLVLKFNRKSSFINKVSKDGTALFIAVKYNNFDIVKLLLSFKEIDPMLYNYQMKTPLQAAIESGHFSIFNALLDAIGDNIQNYSRDLEFIVKQIIIFLVNSNTTQNNKRIDDIENKSNDDLKSVLNRIIEIKCINPNIIIEDSSLLLYACRKNELEIVKKLFMFETIDPNLYSPLSGYSPLMVSISNSCEEIAEIIVNHPRTRINYKNYSDETALTLAVTRNMPRIVQLIMNREDFDPEDNDVNFNFFFASPEISKILIKNECIDVNKTYNFPEKIQFTSKKNGYREMRQNANNFIFDYSFLKDESMMPSLNKTKLVSAVKAKDIELVEMIINHRTFDKEKSNVIQSLFIAIMNNYVDIFKKLFVLADSWINTCKNEDGRTLYEYATVYSKKGETLKEIINHPLFDGNFDIYGSFIQIFRSITYVSIPVLEILYEYDQKHNHLINLNKLLPSGETFYTSIIFSISNIKQVARFLIDHGADPNMPNSQGTYPLEYAIKNNSYDISHELLISKKINFLKKNFVCLNSTNFKTYLHLAASSSNTDILKDFLSLNVIDVNTEDDAGETPLFCAVRFSMNSNIELFFEDEKLDFQHVNKNGLDVLDVFKRNSKHEDHSGMSKEDFLNILVPKLTSSSTKVFQRFPVTAAPFPFKFEGQPTFPFSFSNTFGGDKVLKIFLVGDKNVGKESIVKTFFGDDNKSFCNAFSSKTIDVDGKNIQFQFIDMDTEYFLDLRNDVIGFIVVVYDVTNRESFLNLRKCVEKAIMIGKKTFIVGNKANLEEQRCVNTDEGRSFAGSLGIEFDEVREGNKEDVERLFVKIAKDSQ